MKISFGAGTPEVPVVVLSELKAAEKWNANLFCPIHPALRHVPSLSLILDLTCQIILMTRQLSTKRIHSQMITLALFFA